MEYEEENNNENNSLLDRIKESPRTVSALIIILIVAAAMYAFSGDDTNLQEELALQETANEETTETETEGETASESTGEEGGDQQTSEDAPVTHEETETPEAVATPEPVSREQLAEATQSLPEASRNDEGFTEVAQTGDGITHLARQATTRYLNERDDLSLSDEHRIFMEDYIQNSIGTQGLEVGEQVMISHDVLRSAADAAQQLNASQLQNLSQYTHVLG